MFVMSIQYTQVGNVKLSSIGIGTWAWGNRFLWSYDPNNDGELKNTYDYCLTQGINWFDTADSYGTGDLNGRSEELLGIFSKSTKFKRPNIITKIAPYPWRVGSQSFITAFQESTNRLQSSPTVVQLHWPPSFQWQEREYLKAFCDIVDAGNSTQIGVSNYGPKGLIRVSRILKEYSQKSYSNQESRKTQN